MLSKYLPSLREKYAPDAIIVNDENISHGKWPRLNQIHWLEQQGIDIFTGGNHSLESREDIRDYMEKTDSRQLRPSNFLGDNLPGKGERVFTVNGQKLLVINLIGTIFMSQSKELYSNPYQEVNKILAQYEVESLDGIVVDFHKETTSEWYAMANFLDGRVSVLFGTHTHVQSADAEIWPEGMGFINDIGFSWARRSIIGVDWNSVKHRFYESKQEGLMVPDEHGPGVLSGLFVEIIDKKCAQFVPIRILD